MFYHLIPLAEVKRSAVTYWRPGRDTPASDNAWVLLLESDSGCAASIVDIPAGVDVDAFVEGLRNRSGTPINRC